jgi:predicted nucleotidyltransferase
VRKTFGLAVPLREALARLAGQVELAFVYGSVAKGQDTSASDIDLMIVSDTLGYADVMAALHPVIEGLGRAVHPTIYARSQLAGRVADGNAFIAKVLAQPKLWIVGGEHDLPA